SLAVGRTTYAAAGAAGGGVARAAGGAGGLAGPVAAADASSSAGNDSSNGAAVDPAVHGAEIANQFGCLACHATDHSSMVGPGWGGLYGATETLVDGTGAVV